MLYFILFLALFWGVLWAAYLQFTAYGHYLSVRRTWMTVVIGVGIDLLLIRVIIPTYEWILVCTVIFLSSIAIIARALYNEQQDETAIVEINGD